ncbi:RNA polymerase sigma factor [Micromonospora sp. SH-82]|uniref:RNA polymerase sigma factor n=1 Tax=Micromonospora sp. SH-82 TaxID=3132938 RepID=UPI003EB917F9
MTGDLTEAALAARGGDEEAFRLLYRSLQPGLLRYLTVLVGTDAEDVASETWLQVARDLPTFSGGEFRAWAVTIARNRAMDHLRRERRRPALPVPVQTFADLPGDTDTELQVGEIFGTDRALALISTLPPREAEAVLLRAVVGLDAQSAGRILGRRPGAVRTAAHRGLRRLAALLGRPDPDAPPADARGVVPDPRPGSGSRSRTPHAEPADG